MRVARALAREGAEAALAALRAAPRGFDAVLMDGQMPVLGGLSATRAIRSELGLTELPVIAFTAGVLDEEWQRALAAGVNDFLAKPVDLKAMALLLQRLYHNTCPRTRGGEKDTITFHGLFYSTRSMTGNYRS